MRDTKQARPESMLYLTEASLLTATSSCTFVQKLPAPDGTILATSLCELEGETGRAIVFFSLARAQSTPGAIVISDEYGEPFDEIVPCS